MKKMFKTTIVIWSNYDPNPVELEDLAQSATDGDAYCSVQRTEEVSNPRDDPDWDGTDFFNSRGE